MVPANGFGGEGADSSTFGGNPLAMAIAGKVVEIVTDAAGANGLLAVTTGDNVMCLLPPLIQSFAEIDDGLKRLRQMVAAISGRGGKAVWVGE